MRNPLIEDRAWFVHDLVSTQPAYIGEVSCTAFATRLRQFLSGDEPVAPLPQSAYGKDRVLGLTATPTQQLPNKTYALLLIKVALRFLGDDYHLLLRKTIIEKVDTLYRERRFEDNIFLCRLFALFALGEMYTNRRISAVKQHQIPGAGYFMQAMSLLRGVPEEVSLSYIETLLVIVSSVTPPPKNQKKNKSKQSKNKTTAVQLIIFPHGTVDFFPGSQPDQLRVLLCGNRPTAELDLGPASQSPRRPFDLFRGARTPGAGVVECLHH